MSLRDYFSNNKIFTGTEKPTQGKFGVGDIIVNIGPNSAEEPMWICVEAGTPGVWELCSGVNEEEIADIVQANALSAIDYTDGVDIQIDGGEIGNMNELQTTDKSSIVGAINELFQNANNGKELIANAIGEPLSSEDTFSAMSNDINGLLSQFKTNMMNSGVTVNSSDKFKSLIDKIKGLTEGEGNKGIQMVSGIIENLPSGSEPFITVDLNFKAEFIIINSYTDYLGFNNPDESGYLVAYEGGAGLIRGANSIAFYPKGTASGSAALYDFLTNALFSNCYVNDTGFRLPIYQPYNNSFSKPNNPTDVRYVAIGVGEEDTTLRDSLADILGDKGVDVTEEDDMASLITKVDSISGGLDIISATELPATGRENQICVITDNPDYGVLVTTNANEALIDPTIVMYLGNSSSVDTTLGTQVQIDNMMYYFNRVMFGSERLASYIWSNNHWSELTKKYIPLFENGTFPSQDVAGITYVTNTSKYVQLYSDPSNAGNYTISIAGSTSGYRGFSFANYINFANFTKINMTVRTTSTSDQPKLCVTCHNYSSMLGVYEAISISYIHKIDASLTTSFKDISIDISNWTSTGILSFHTSKKATGNIYITRISLE